MSNDGVLATPPPTIPRPRLLVSLPPGEAAAFLPAETRAALTGIGEVTEAAPGDLETPAAFAHAAAGVDVFVTSWGFPRLEADRLADAPDLKLVVHAASSLRAIVSDDFWATGIPISQAGAAMSPAVAELSLAFTLALLRNLPRFDHALHGGADWESARESARPREISGCRIGVVGASRSGRRYIQSCRALGAEVHVYDPYVGVDDELAAASVSLRDLLTHSDVLALHAPATPETTGMIGAAELALLPDGALVVNTARPDLVDADALYSEVASGRLDAALDVFAHEPLPIDDRWRSLPNVLLTPHRGGATVESRRRAGWIVVDEIRRFMAGEPLQHTLTRAAIERMG